MICGDRLTVAFEVGADVGGAVAAAELDDADGLVCSGGACGESVELRDLDGCVGEVGGGVGFGEASALRGASREVVFLAGDAKVGASLRTVVEAEDGFDVADELGGEIDAAFTDAVGDAVEGLMTEGGAECLLHVGYGSGELDGAAFGAGGVGFDPEAELPGEFADEGYGFGIGAVALAILLAGEALFAELDVERIFGTDDDGDDDFFAVWCGLFRSWFE